MMVVRIEVWPHGDERRAEALATIRIANTGAGSQQVADYDLVLDEENGRRRAAVVRAFARARGWLPLLREALDALDAAEDIHS